MFLIGVCVGDESVYGSVAQPAIETMCSHDAIVLELRSQNSIHEAYNVVLAKARELDGLEGVIFLHQDLEIRDVNFLRKLRQQFLDPTVAVVGAIGAVGVQSLSWWLGEIRGSIQETRGLLNFPSSISDVEMVDGCCFALSPWSVEHLAFDSERYIGFHGYDADICFAARAAGKRVVVETFELTHQTKGGFGDYSEFCRNNEVFRSKWILDNAEDGRPRGALRVEIGGGKICRPGWLNLDHVHGEGTLRRRAEVGRWPFESGTVHSLFASHVLEHIPAGDERIHVMNEAWRVLVPSGSFEIRVPLFPEAAAVADPTHLSFWMPQSFDYFTGRSKESADYGIKVWEMASMVVVDGWELRVVLIRPREPDSLPVPARYWGSERFMMDEVLR